MPHLVLYGTGAFSVSSWAGSWKLAKGTRLFHVAMSALPAGSDSASVGGDRPQEPPQSITVMRSRESWPLYVNEAPSGFVSSRLLVSPGVSTYSTLVWTREVTVILPTVCLKSSACMHA